MNIICFVLNGHDTDGIDLYATRTLGVFRSREVVEAEVAKMVVNREHLSAAELAASRACADLGLRVDMYSKEIMTAYYAVYKPMVASYLTDRGLDVSIMDCKFWTEYEIVEMTMV